MDGYPLAIEHQYVAETLANDLCGAILDYTTRSGGRDTATVLARPSGSLLHIMICSDLYTQHVDF
jgi:hypothetical protein